MPTFTLSGKLLTTSNKALPGFKVSAWDKDKRISDHLGVAFTDRKGQFVITFDEPRFFDDVKDSLPDVFFLIYQGDRVIHTTEGNPIKNAKEVKDLVIQIDLPQDVQPQPMAFLIKGKVVQRQTQRTIPGLKVEAWDRDREISDQLGTSVSDHTGTFSISYDEALFKDAESDDLPDVFFRVFHGEEMVHSTEGKPLKNRPVI
jgi:hypothetical protein